MLSVYFYPKIDIRLIQSPNPYIPDLENALAKYHHRSNTTYNKKGVLDFFTHFFRTNVFVLNWIEDLPLYRYGKFQILVFIVFLYLAKAFDKKIVWLLHNKYSHSINHNMWTTGMFDLMMKHADLILTHSQEGIEFGREKYPKYAHKIKYYMLPIAPIFPALPVVEKQYDLFIWGTIQPYKGVLEFMQYLKTSGNPMALKVLVIGRCFDEKYKKQLMENQSEHVVYDDRFYDMDAIRQFTQQSKFILFTYKPNSVLSSSALMDAIRMRARIIGPRFGAFKDIEADGLVYTYADYADILQRVKNHQEMTSTDQTAIDAFYEAHNWDQFAECLKQEIGQLFGTPSQARSSR